MILHRFDDTVEQDVDALLGSLTMGIKNKWLIGKEPRNGHGKLSFAIKYVTIEPGKNYPMHSSAHTEAMFVLDGSGVVKNDKEQFEIKTGDLVVTQGGEMHSVSNSGKTNLKTLSCIDLFSHE